MGRDKSPTITPENVARNASQFGTDVSLQLNRNILLRASNGYKKWETPIERHPVSFAINGNGQLTAFYTFVFPLTFIIESL